MWLRERGRLNYLGDMLQQQTDSEQRTKQRGRPWPPGVSGNPGGQRAMRDRAAQTFGELVSERGGEMALQPTDLLRLQQAALLIERSKRTRDAGVAVKAANAADRLLRAVPVPTQTPRVPLREQLAAEAAGGGA